MGQHDSKTCSLHCLHDLIFVLWYSLQCRTRCVTMLGCHGISRKYPDTCQQNRKDISTRGVGAVWRRRVASTSLPIFIRSKEGWPKLWADAMLPVSTSQRLHTTYPSIIIINGASLRCYRYTVSLAFSTVQVSRSPLLPDSLARPLLLPS